MTNEVIAAQVADSMVGAANSMFPTIYDAIIAALVMKDKQILTICENCEDNLIKMGKRCPRRSMSNDYCWEK